MFRFLMTLSLLVGLSSGLAAKETWRVVPEGALEYTVLKGDDVCLRLGIAAWGPNWKWFGFGGRAGVDAEGRRSLQQATTIGGTDHRIELKHTAQQHDGNGIVLTYHLAAPQSARLTQICATISPVERFFRGGTCLAKLSGGGQKQVELPFGRGNIGDSVEALIVRDSTGDQIRLDIQPARPVSIDGDGRIQLVGERIERGETRSTQITLRLPAACRFYADEAETLQRSDTSAWFPYPVGPQGVPIDLSFLNKDESGKYVPAGAHGFLKVQGDQFVFEDGTPAKFWGVNLTAGAVLTSPERAEQLAERLARLGCNVVRFHHLDSWAHPIIDYNHPDGTTQHLNPQSMRLLDKTVFELKKRGIYVILDPWVQRCFKQADGVADYGKLGQQGNFNLHPYVYFDARMQELIQKQWQQVWTHINELTGVAYKDEPACVVTEVINEGLFGGLDSVRQEHYRNAVLQLYRTWAKETGGVPAEQTTIFTENHGENNLKFFTHLHRRFYRTSHEFFRDLGVKIPVNATNWGHFTWIVLAQTDLDFMDSHHYYGGDQIGPDYALGGLWLNHPLGLPGSPFGKIAGFAVAGKPLTSSECGNNPPKIYRAAYQLGLAAVASLQGWDSITGYAYSQSGEPRDRLSPYEWESDPASVASLAVGALIFRRGDVAPAKHTIAVELPEEEVWRLRWEDGGRMQYWNTPGFNCATEQHKVVVCPPGVSAQSLAPVKVLSVEDAHAYKHPNTELRSDTGQLWRDWRLGLGKIDTPRTQVAYGKLGQSVKLAQSAKSLQTTDCQFTIRTPFAVAALSSLTGEDIVHSKKLLLVAVARAENSGTTLNMARTKIVDQGKAPVLAEPVVGTIRFRTDQPGLVLYPVKVDGTRGPGVKLPVKDGVATIELEDGYQTIFYEIQSGSEPSGAQTSDTASGIIAPGIIAPGAKVVQLADGFEFTEGPAADGAGNVFFTDQPNDRILRWSTDGKLSTFMEPCGRSNGLCFDRHDNLWACADEKNQLWRIDPSGKATVVVRDYRGKLLGGPNDLWIRPDGGVYFTDPFYKRPYWKRGPQEQDGQCVYYLPPDHRELRRVVDDLEQPNGIIGTPDGKTLYVADLRAKKTYAYDIRPDGTLTGKRLFCRMGSDGMTIDSRHNVYLTGNGVTVFDPAGKQIAQIDVSDSGTDERWTANVCFGGKDRRTLFITASHGLYSLRMRVGGVGSQ